MTGEMCAAANLRQPMRGQKCKTTAQSRYRRFACLLEASNEKSEASQSRIVDAVTILVSECLTLDTILQRGNPACWYPLYDNLVNMQGYPPYEDSIAFAPAFKKTNRRAGAIRQCRKFKF